MQSHLENISQLGVQFPGFWAFVCSLIAGYLLVLTKHLHGGISMDSSFGIQKVHTNPTPRIGGVAILLGSWVAWAVTSSEVHTLLGYILIAGIPAFTFGFLEDLTKRVGVLPRLLATMLSGFVAWWLSGYSLTRVDIWGLDSLLPFLIVSIPFTVFAVGGIANSINIIDGFNGLASSSATYAFLGMAWIAHSVGDDALAGVSMVLALSVLGFLCVNWPRGALFLGDGGSYFVGFSLAWMAVMLIERNMGVTPFAVLLICIHPFTEVIFSIYRRGIKKLSAGTPDRLHFHSLLHARYIRQWFAKSSQSTQNSLTGAAVGLITLLATFVACFTYDSRAWSAFACVSFMIAYVTVYAKMVRFHWCSPITFLFRVPTHKLYLGTHPSLK